MKTNLPPELRKLREWIEEHRPYKDQTLEEALVADTSPFINPARALAERGFQDAVYMLASAIREGKVGIRRPHHEPEPEPIDPHDPPVMFPSSNRTR
jgi:hypothetical protein